MEKYLAWKCDLNKVSIPGDHEALIERGVSEGRDFCVKCKLNKNICYSHASKQASKQIIIRKREKKETWHLQMWGFPLTEETM